MNERHDGVLQEWFDRSKQLPPGEPFVAMVLVQVRRKERRLQVLRCLAVSTILASISLLLPELVGPLNTLASLPVMILAAAGSYWPLLVMLTGYLVLVLGRQVGRITSIG